MVQLPLHNALVIYQCTASGSLLPFFDFQTTIISSVLIITQTCQTGEEGGWEGGGEQNWSFCAVHPKLEGKTRKRVSLVGTRSAAGAGRVRDAGGGARAAPGDPAPGGTLQEP